MLESLKEIKSIQDIRVEKARMRYEALLAENKLNESVRAAEQLFTFVSNLRRSLTVVRQTYEVFSRIGIFFSRLFGKQDKQPSSGRKRDERASEEDVHRY